MLKAHKPDPLHHNYNRSQSDRGRFAARLSWLRFQLKASRGNVGSALSQVNEQVVRVRKELTPEASRQLDRIRVELNALIYQLQDLSDEIAELNSPAKWVD